MRNIVCEHNRLNGFAFVLIEFGAIVAVALFFALAQAEKRNVTWSLCYAGIACNAITICLITLKQIRQGEKSSSFIGAFSPESRKRIQREHPDLGKHTLAITAAALAPFVLAAMVILDKTETNS